MYVKGIEKSTILRTKQCHHGGGFLATFPDLPGCMADGETPEEAVIEAKDAFECWMEARKEWGREYSKPTVSGMNAGQG